MKRHAMSYRVLTGALILAVVGFAAACDDPNRFGEANPPEVTGVQPSASTVAEGQTVSFAITAEGDRDIVRVRAQFSGAFTKDTTFGVSQNTQISATLAVTVPGGTVDPQLTAQVTVTDIADSTSAAVNATVTVTDATPPTASASPGPNNVGSGQVIQIGMNAADARGLAFVQLDVSSGTGYDTTLVDTLSQATPLTSYSQTWQLVAPDINIGTLSFVPSAIDINGNSAEGDTATIQVGDQAGPDFTALATVPDSTIPLGDSLQVLVSLTDPSGIKQVTFIGLMEQGDPSMGTDSVIELFAQKTITFPRPTLGDSLPKSFDLDPYLFPTSQTLNGPVELFVVAEDSLGNVSDTTKLMYVGGPDVSLTYPPDGFAVGVGSNFNVRIAVDDGVGIDSLHLVLGGAMNQTINVALPPRTDTPFVAVQNVVMPGSQGTVTMQALAWNTQEIRGQSRTVNVDVLSQPPSDTVPPIVSVTAERLVPPPSAPRMEMLDQIRIVVSAFDGNAGLDQIRLSITASRGTQQDTIFEIANFAGSKNLEQLIFQVPVDSLYALFGVTDPAALDSILPENMDLSIHGFARDTVIQAACSVGFEEQRPCTAVGPYRFASNADGLPLRIEAVRGYTVLLDNPDATIADLAIDTVDDRLFLSNVTENLVEFLQLDADPRNAAFQSPVQVGSEPLGLFMGERVVSAGEPGFGGIAVSPGDTMRTLLVANSGGTNMSLVHLEANASNVQEVDLIRLNTPNSVLFEIDENTDEFGNVRYTAEYFDLADRPQFLAQDSLLRVVYSTRATAEAPITTVRFVHADPDPTSTTDVPEVRYLLTSAMVDPDNETSLTLANVDSLAILAYAGASDSVRVYMHEPGYPGNVIANAQWEAQIEDALADLRGQIDAIMLARGIPAQAPMFYPFFMRGTWDFDALSWGDTTFVSASGDRGKIALGEGAMSPVGRIMIWHADERATYSDAIQMTDLVNNASEVVLGVGLNQNGTLGVARGNEATYFFTPDLRLQGLFRQADVGGAGATFHPDHSSVTDGGHTTTDGAGVAFTGTSNHSIDVVNTFHFNQVNSLVIRDDVVGPLRAGPPLATDNGGQPVATCLAGATPEDCVVAKLYGITSAGGVVIVNVRRRDLEPYATP